MFTVQFYDRLSFQLFKTKTFETVSEMEDEVNNYGPKGRLFVFFENHSLFEGTFVCSRPFSHNGIDGYQLFFYTNLSDKKYLTSPKKPLTTEEYLGF
ncbi:hypothetical protein SAMN05192533_12168 [Mesobacillus persicus]|uniref:Uncharacterized protein n=1 Tax=Mesobacillus persicus TaxID=930146 RepID=A0A1H8JKD6_9BACI|nr:hypothetical protein [Mesobacillus persicus]SEN81152.1 hypothetical protein SAMN05192533_12168 [Mesobacillus persicus]